MKKSSNLSRLMDYAGNYRYLSYSSWILSALSALAALFPFWYIWQIIRDVLAVAPNFGAAQNLVYHGWMAVLFAGCRASYLYCRANVLAYRGFPHRF